MKLRELKSIIRQEVKAALKEQVIGIQAVVKTPKVSITKTELARDLRQIVQPFAFVDGEALANLDFRGTKLQLLRLYNELKNRGFQTYFEYPKPVDSTQQMWYLSTKQAEETGTLKP